MACCWTSGGRARCSPPSSTPRSASISAPERRRCAPGLGALHSFPRTRPGGAAAAFFDVPWIPVFVIVLFLIDPSVGWVTVFGGLILVGLALLQERLMRPALKEANDGALR